MTIWPVEIPTGTWWGIKQVDQYFQRLYPSAAATFQFLPTVSCSLEKSKQWDSKKWGQSLRGPPNSTRVEEMPTKSELLSCLTMAGTNLDTFCLLFSILYGLNYYVHSRLKRKKKKARLRKFTAGLLLVRCRARTWLFWSVHTALIFTLFVVLVYYWCCSKLLQILRFKNINLLSTSSGG